MFPQSDDNNSSFKKIVNFIGIFWKPYMICVPLFPINCHLILKSIFDQNEYQWDFVQINTFWSFYWSITKIIFQLDFRVRRILKSYASRISCVLWNNIIYNYSFFISLHVNKTTSSNFVTDWFYYFVIPILIKITWALHKA